ncbi:BOLA-LIKE PROTEIN-RELATED [Salix purpurea]|uniref:BOLA-LIKE PROTEIN-RELATED n=1 Tax=Salix purpurea TaxID=77065 RepID=A0A9Q0VTJ4_SALPP|nr:BOLA-LIKE PROTEIN-RELATED [Salix purpurea]
MLWCLNYDSVIFWSVLEVIDTSGGCGASFAIEIVSEQFEGKRLLERHRLVNAALEEEMKEIHALSIKESCDPSAVETTARDPAIYICCMRSCFQNIYLNSRAFGSR